jgi:hypothetical protein
MDYLQPKAGHSISSQMCTVTGPRIELAITLIDTMKSLFRNIQVSKLFGNIKIRNLFDSIETVIELNGLHIEAYPSHHLDSMRGLKDASFIYLDEADFFPPGRQQAKTPMMYQRYTEV